jgi:hypothetical protein
MLKRLPEFYLTLALGLFLWGSSVSQAASIFLSGTFEILQREEDFEGHISEGDLFDFLLELDGTVLDSEPGEDLFFENVVLGVSFSRHATNVGTYNPVGGPVTYSYLLGNHTSPQTFSLFVELDGLPPVTGAEVWNFFGGGQATPGSLFNPGLANEGVTFEEAWNSPLTYDEIVESDFGFGTDTEQTASGGLSTFEQVPEPGVAGFLGLLGAGILFLRRRHG